MPLRELCVLTKGMVVKRKSYCCLAVVLLAVGVAEICPGYELRRTLPDFGEVVLTTDELGAWRFDLSDSVAQAGVCALKIVMDTPEEDTAVMLYLLGESMVGRRASDILVLADWLKGRFGRPARLLSTGSVAIAAAHAFAAERGLFSGIEVSRTPPSWSELVEATGAPPANRYAWCVHGALLEYDWTDLLQVGKKGVK